MRWNHIWRRRIKIYATLISVLILYLNIQYLTGDSPILMTGRVTGNLNMCVDQQISFPALSYLNATENVPFSYDLNVTNESSFSSITYGDDTSLFSINSSTGVISFTPRTDQIGSYQVNITARNDFCGNNDTSISFTFNVNPSNYAPSVNMANQVLTEDVAYTYNVSQNATDPDGDAINFYDNTALFVIGESSGIIAFTPTNSDVGAHTVTIYVVDSHSALGSQNVIFNITNVNDAPALSSIGAQTAYVSEPWNITLTATDVDASEQLTFRSNYSGFLLNSGKISTVSQSASYNISFATNWTANGTYSINITVNDTSGVEDSEVISYTILYRNHAPNITSYTPTNQHLALTQTASQDFGITASDPDGTTPSAQWFANNALYNTSYNFTYTANVSGTINITVVITDGELNDSRSWLLTVTPPAVGEAPPALAGGAAGGGGGSLCSELWTCTDWSPCQANNVQLRECADFKKCGALRNRPNLTQTCIFVEHPSCFDGVKNQDEILPDCGGLCKPCPSCNDKIQNQGETGIDCGGPCPACKHLEVPKMLGKYRDRVITPLQIFTYPNESWVFWAMLPVMIFLLFRVVRVVKLRKKPKAKLPKTEPILEEIGRLIKVTELSMKKQDYRTAKAAYGKINHLYSQLPAKEKTKVYDRIAKLSK